MNNRRDILVSLVWRLGLAVPVFVAGWMVLSNASGGWAATGPLLFGMALLVAAAIIIAPAIARLIAEPSGNLFWPGWRFDRPQPAYGIPESKRKNGLVQEAFIDFRAISEAHPQELKAYVEMIDIAVVDMKNAELAASVFHQGMQTLKSEQARGGLSRMYEAISSRMAPSTVRPSRVIVFRKGASGPPPPSESAPAPEAGNNDT